jgi:hypothetical protein
MTSTSLIVITMSTNLKRNFNITVGRIIKGERWSGWGM